jgi:hypothetical protein
MALVWNALGLFAVVGDLLLTPADIAALPAQEQALFQARPVWSIVASLVAVVGGTVACVGLLLRKRWSLVLLYASLAGVVVQDVGIFGVAGAAEVMGTVPLVLQTVVVLVAIGLVLLGHKAAGRSWLA